MWYRLESLAISHSGQYNVEQVMLLMMIIGFINFLFIPSTLLLLALEPTTTTMIILLLTQRLLRPPLHSSQTQCLCVTLSASGTNNIMIPVTQLCGHGVLLSFAIANYFVDDVVVVVVIGGDGNRPLRHNTTVQPTLSTTSHARPNWRQNLMLLLLFYYYYWCTFQQLFWRLIEWIIL